MIITTGRVCYDCLKYGGMVIHNSIVQLIVAFIDGLLTAEIGLTRI